jgi:soluble lytic murein transglycosylase
VSAASSDLALYLDHDQVDTLAIAQFARAASLLRDGKLREAQSSFQSVALNAPALADWAHLLSADAAARLRDTVQAREELAAGSQWLAQEWGWRVRVRGLEVAASRLEAAKLVLAEAPRLHRPGSQADALRVGAELLLSAGDTAHALVTLRGALSGPLPASTISGAAGLLASVARQPGDLLQSAIVLGDAGEYSHAAAILPRLVRSSQTAGTARSRLRLILARHYFETRKYVTARQLATALANDRSEPADARAQARLILGRTLLRENKRSAAITQLELAAKGPGAATVAEAGYILGDLAERVAVARNHFEQAASLAPESSAGTEAMMRLGAYAFATNDFGAAMHWFERGAQAHPQHRQRALYWVGRVQLATGDTLAPATFARVLTLDPVSYYGFQASPHARTKAILDDGPVSSDLAQRRAATAVSRLRALRAAGLLDIESFEYARVRDAFADERETLYAVAEALHENGYTQRAILLGRELRRTAPAWDARLLRIVYPFPYRDIILAAADKSGVDGYFAAALIRQESAFNPRARSSAGALGLMQLMPRTGRTIALETGTRITTAQLYDPNVNVRLGMHHLGTLLRQHNGRLAHVLSAYNAGEHRLAEWLDFRESADDELLTERIPFAETRDYVRIVQQNAHIYRLAYRNITATQ